MSPIVFWPALLTAFVISMLLSTAPPHNVAQLAAAGLAWITTFALGWTRWSGRPASWLARLAALAGAIILVALVHDWLPRSDVFVVYRRNCPPRMGSFWPLGIAWLGGAGLQTFTLFGKRFRFAGLRSLRSWQSVLWWLSTIVWTAACAYVFVRNINAAALGASLFVMLKVAAGLLALACVIAVPLWLSARPEAKRRQQAQADYARIPAADCTAMLDAIDHHARSLGDFRLLYRTCDAANDSDPLAHVGGNPLAAKDESWPVDQDGQAATFLLQLPLHAALGAAWEERVLVVYLMQHELLVKSHARAPGLVVMQTPAGASRLPAQALQPLGLPPATPAAADDDEADDGLDADALLRLVPGLAAKLSNWTTQPGRVLPMLLTGSVDAGGYGIEDMIVVGGAPVLIQGPHDPTCTLCGQPLRFLCQFADVTDSNELGDCGVGYVYGCDAHPEHCQAFVDCC